MSTYNRKGLAHSRKVITKSSHQVQCSIYRETLEFNRQKYHEYLFSNRFVSSSSVLTIRDKNSNDFTNLLNRKLKNNDNNSLPNDSEFKNDVPLIFSKLFSLLKKQKNRMNEGIHL